MNKDYRLVTITKITPTDFKKINMQNIDIIDINEFLCVLATDDNISQIDDNIAELFTSVCLKRTLFDFEAIKRDTDEIPDDAELIRMSMSKLVPCNSDYMNLEYECDGKTISIDISMAPYKKEVFDEYFVVKLIEEASYKWVLPQDVIDAEAKATANFTGLKDALKKRPLIKVSKRLRPWLGVDKGVNYFLVGEEYV